MHEVRQRAWLHARRGCIRSSACMPGKLLLQMCVSAWCDTQPLRYVKSGLSDGSVQGVINKNEPCPRLPDRNGGQLPIVDLPPLAARVALRPLVLAGGGGSRVGLHQRAAAAARHACEPGASAVSARSCRMRRTRRCTSACAGCWALCSRHAGGALSSSQQCCKLRFHVKSRTRDAPRAMTSMHCAHKKVLH